MHIVHSMAILEYTQSISMSRNSVGAVITNESVTIIVSGRVREFIEPVS